MAAQRVSVRVGLLGGSFDPVHRAHLGLASHALAQLGLDRVECLPAAAPWQRAPLGASPEQRCTMLALALPHAPGVTLNPQEIERDGPTYTIDTLRTLRAGEPGQDTTYFWLMGGDQLANFCTWRDWAEIAQRVTLAVFPRPGYATDVPDELQRQLARVSRNVQWLDWTPMAISATELRQRVAQGLPYSHLTYPEVADYIEGHHLYRG